MAIPIIGSGDVKLAGAGIRTSNIIGYAVGTPPGEGEVFPAMLTDDEGRYLILATPEDAERDALALMVTGNVDGDELVVFPVGVVAAEHLMSKSIAVRKPAKN